MRSLDFGFQSLVDFGFLELYSGLPYPGRSFSANEKQLVFTTCLAQPDYLYFITLPKQNLFILVVNEQARLKKNEQIDWLTLVTCFFFFSRLIQVVIFLDFHQERIILSSFQILTPKLQSLCK